jgi:2-polyprenyl-3-methyl-5-hydroxy-6-metoxy-1,4-benzoquinol methylase
MEFYKNIYKAYDKLFPFQPKQMEFVISHAKMINEKVNILDIGCGTASLAIQLARRTYSIEAFDVSHEMIKIAKEKKEDLYPYKYPVFKICGMENFKKEYQNQSFKLILCFGNTIVHLNSFRAIEKFISDVYKQLDKDSLFLFQILNYDYILDNNIDSLPTVGDNKTFMKRKYVFREDGLIDFNTSLVDVESNTEINSSVPLFPIRKDEISKILTDTGFSTPEFYGNFAMDPLMSYSIPLVGACKKL